MLKPISLLLHPWLLLVLIGSFSSIVYYINNEPGAAALPLEAVTPVEIVRPSLPAPATHTPVPRVTSAAVTLPEAGWSLLQPGLERRVFEIYNHQNQHVESLHIWRLDQKYFRMDVAHAPAPRSLDTWQKETNASIVVNGGYYSIANEIYFPDGLTIVNGKATGRSFNGFGGMLAIKSSGAELRWLVEKPYDPYEPLQAAFQSFPILVRPGGELGFGAERENHVGARRTVIAQDQDGRILLMVAPQGFFTLHQLSLYLTESDLNLDIAVNLDGGGSTGILIANPREIISPTRPIPFVVLVHPR